MQSRPSSGRAPAREWWWVFDPRFSLAARASLFTAAGAIAFVLLIAWIAGARLRGILERQQRAALETLAAQISERIDRRMFERYRTLQLAANLPVMTRPDASRQEQRLTLEAVQQSAAEFAWIGLADGRGRVVAATGRVFEDADVGDRGWFLTGRERPHVGAVSDRADLARQLKNPDELEAPARFFDLAVPVPGPAGERAGVIGAHVRWGWTRDVQMSVVPEAALREKIAVTLYAGPSEVLLDSGNTGWSQPPPAPALPDDRRFRGAILERAGPVDYLTGYARSRGYREFKGLGWITVVRQPLERVLAPVGELRRSIVGWGGALTLLGVLATWALASRFTRQFRRIGAAAERIHEGDILSVLPRPADGSELARMCDRLGDLVEDLRAREQALRAENARLRGIQDPQEPDNAPR